VSEPAIILLAAGASRRFAGGDKLLARLNGEAMVTHVARALAQAAPQAQRIGVVRPDDPARVRAIARFVTDCVVNPEADSGIASSIRVGLKRVQATAPGAMVVQGDMPGLDVATVRRLTDAFIASGSAAIVHPVTPDGRQATPVVWPRDLFDDLCALEGDQGGKPVIRRHADRVQAVPFDDAAPFADVDTQEALAEWRAAAAAATRSSG